MDKKWFKFGKFTELSKEEAATLNATELAEYVKDAQENKIKEVEKMFEEKLKETITKEEFEQLKSNIEAINKANESELDARIKEFEKFAETVAKRVEESSKAEETYKGFKKFELQLSKIEIKGEKLADKLKKREAFTFAIKFDSGDVTGLDGYQLQPGVGQLPEPKFVLSSYFRVSPIQINNDGTAAYDDWDETTTVRAADYVAEGQLIPASEATFVRRSVQIRKFGDSIKMTEETVNDFARFTAELARFLTRNLLRVVNKQMWNGDDTAGIFGLVSRARPFDCTTITAKEQVPVPNLVTLINVLRSRIMNRWYTGTMPTENMADDKYNPDTVFLSWTDYTTLLNAQNANGTPLYPSGLLTPGIKLVPTTLVADNELLILDSNYVEMIGDPEKIEIELGMEGDDFQRDMRTLKARVRTQLLIREVDRDCAFYVSDVTACLTALTTPSAP